MSDLSLLLAPSQTSLVLPEDMPVEQWEEVGKKLSGMAKHMQWWWGDWLNFGESRYGEKYKVVVEKFGINPKTARQYAWVAREFEMSNRLDISWTHHLAVAGISDESERTELLQMAKSEGWSKSRLQQEIKEAPVNESKLTAVSEPEELSSVIAALRFACAEIAERFGIDRYDVMVTVLISEADALTEMFNGR
jgi:hypothetical protein